MHIQPQPYFSGFVPLLYELSPLTRLASRTRKVCSRHAFEWDRQHKPNIYGKPFTRNPSFADIWVRKLTSRNLNKSKRGEFFWLSRFRVIKLITPRNNNYWRPLGNPFGRPVLQITKQFMVKHSKDGLPRLPKSFVLDKYCYTYSCNLWYPRYTRTRLSKRISEYVYLFFGEVKSGISTVQSCIISWIVVTNRTVNGFHTLPCNSQIIHRRTR